MSAIPSQVKNVFETYPNTARAKLMELRALIFETAKSEHVGELEECLKWGQPSYLTGPKIGSTVRLGWRERKPDQISLYFICTTHLVDHFRQIYPDVFNFENGRVINFELSEAIPKTELGHCLAMALTYHRNKT